MHVQSLGTPKAYMATLFSPHCLNYSLKERKENRNSRDWREGSHGPVMLCVPEDPQHPRCDSKQDRTPSVQMTARTPVVRLFPWSRFWKLEF